MVELFFGQLTDKAIRRGIFHSVPDLIDAIETYLAAHNQDPQPFTWTATTEQILDKVRRGRVTLDAITNSEAQRARARVAAPSAAPTSAADSCLRVDCAGRSRHARAAAAHSGRCGWSWEVFVPDLGGDVLVIGARGEERGDPVYRGVCAVTSSRMAGSP